MIERSVLRGAYDREAEGYDARFAALQAPKHAALLEALGDFAAGRDVLDAGAGTGLFRGALQARGIVPRFLVELDLSHCMLTKAGGSARIQADLDALPFAPASFDVIVCVTALIDPARDRFRLHAFAAIARPGARLAVSWLLRDRPDPAPLCRASGWLPVGDAFACGGQDVGITCIRA